MAKIVITLEDDPGNPEGCNVTTEFDPPVDPADKHLLTTAQEAAFAVADFLQLCEDRSIGTRPN